MQLWVVNPLNGNVGFDEVRRMLVSLVHLVHGKSGTLGTGFRPCCAVGSNMLGSVVLCFA